MMSEGQLTKSQIRELELLAKMTNEYNRYLAGCEQGGDWDLHSFMKSLNKKAIKVMGAS